MASDALTIPAGEIDNIVHDENEALNKTASVGGHLDDTATTAATEGNVMPARITAQRAFHVNLRNNSGTEIGTSSSPVSVDDGGASLTVDGTLAATQSGTWNINNVSGTISLPTGAATSANQLPDGHNVTVDNAAGASAVNIQDGGNSITVDNGTLSNTGGGVESGALRVTIASDSTGVLSVDDNGGSLTVDGTVTANAGSGTFTVTDDGSFTLAANSGVDVGDVTVNNTSGSSGVFIQGQAATGAAAAGNPVLIAGSNIIGGVNTPPTIFTTSGLNCIVTNAVDASGVSFSITNGGMQITGNDDHDEVDTGNVVKTGGKAITIGSDNATTDGPSQVAANDRVQWLADRQGYQHIKSWNYEEDSISLSALDDTYDNTTTSNDSADFDTYGHNTGVLSFTLSSSNSPSNFTFFVQQKVGSNYFDIQNGFLSKFIFDDTATSGGIDRAYLIPLPVGIGRVSVTATGTNATDTFTLSNCEIRFRTNG